MNNKPNYKKGKRKRITEEIMQAGCMPMRDVALLKDDNFRTLKQQIYIMINDGTLLSTGSGQNKILTINDYEKRKSEMTGISEKIKTYYEAFGKEDARNASGLNRNGHDIAVRNAETVLFLSGTEVKTKVGEKRSIFAKGIDGSNYYSPREIKGVNEYKTSKAQNGEITGKTRVNGMIVSPGGSYAVYNAYDHVLEADYGESRIQTHCNNILSGKTKNKDSQNIKGAITLLKDYDVMMKYIEPSDKRIGSVIDRYTYLYPRVYGITLDQNGQKMIDLMCRPGWDEELITMFAEDTSKNGYEEIDCDGKDADGNYYLVFCVPDIKKLREFIRGAVARHDKSRYRVVCFDFQKDFVVRATAGACKVFTVKYEDYIKEIRGGNEDDVSVKGNV